MRLCLDEDIIPLAAHLLRERGIDAVSTHECGMAGCTDEDQLTRASREGRCLVTRNRDDFIRLTAAGFGSAMPHYGVLIVPFTIPNTRPRRLVEALARIVGLYPQGLPPYTVAFLPKAPR